MSHSGNSLIAFIVKILKRVAYSHYSIYSSTLHLTYSSVVSELHNSSTQVNVSFRPVNSGDTFGPHFSGLISAIWYFRPCLSFFYWDIFHNIILVSGVQHNTYCKIIITISLVNIHHHTQLKLFFYMWTWRLYSLSNFQICNTVLTTVTMLYMTGFPWLMMVLCPDKSTVSWKYHKSKNALNTPNLPNLIA